MAEPQAGQKLRVISAPPSLRLVKLLTLPRMIFSPEMSNITLIII